ncbi:MAG TPA: DMT family transporter [Alphaproteobacteria bacterium]|nr:DMT family transporter [Alphaproteobacteria bacterium]
MTAKEKAIACAVGGFSLFSLGDAIFKHLTGTLPVPAICAWAAVFASAYLFAFSFAKGGPGVQFRTAHPVLHLTRGAIVFAHANLAIAAFAALPMATVYSILFLAPFLIALLAMRFLGERASRDHWIAIAAGFVGILVVLRPGVAPFSSPVAAGLGAAALFAVSWLMVRRIGTGSESPLCFAFYVQIMIALGSFGLMLAGGGAMPQGVQWGWLAAVGAMSAGGNVLLARAYLLAVPSIVAPFHYVQMLWAVALGALVFGDFPDLWTIVGAGIIVGAGLFLIRVEARQSEKA